jgi:putative ABC transport system ATP-binding protein/lipoprotein-releasing system ATP-binding protein
MGREALVRASGLARTYRSGRGEVTALADATFTIDPGETIAIVGPSGSGKSTLLHLVGGLDRPTRGTIEWPALGAAETLRPRSIAMAFQGPSLLAPLTVLENVALPIVLAGGNEAAAERVAAALLARFEVDTVAAKLPEELSGGQSQRAGLARALAGSVRLVLADEPTGQQDRATGERAMEALLDLAAETGASVVVATHDPAVAALCSARWTVERGWLRTGVIPCSA